MKRKIAAKNLNKNINRTISTNDGMYVTGQEAHYFSAGYSAIRNIHIGMTAADLVSPTNILDMACGYGRVLRMLMTYFPEANLTACDIDHNAVNFCAETFGAEKLYSDTDFINISPPKQFDLIWCGSLVTHLDISHWEAFISFCIEHLKKNGLLIFTTHGSYTARMITEYDFFYGLERTDAYKLIDEYMASGFGYCHYPSQSQFGLSITSTAWVASFIRNHTELQLCSVVEMGWDNHQDVYSCCYKQKVITGEIGDYSEKLIDYIKLKLNGIKSNSNSCLCLEEKIAHLVETKIIEDNMPFGPRIQHILIKLVLNKVNKL